MRTIVDISNQRFGRWTAVSRIPRTPRLRSCTRWLCKCDCGKEMTVGLSSLVNGTSRSCGCLRVDSSRARFTTHGQSAGGTLSQTYRTWLGMRARCGDPSNTAYPEYGGRGIAVCDEWNGSYEAFAADMGERPPGMTIDRIDGTKGYAPGNCRWATARDQARNRPGFVKLNPESVNEIRGRYEHGEPQSSLAKRFGVSSGLISMVVNRKLWTDVP